MQPCQQHSTLSLPGVQLRQARLTSSWHPPGTDHHAHSCSSDWAQHKLQCVGTGQRCAESKRFALCRGRQAGRWIIHHDGPQQCVRIRHVASVRMQLSEAQRCRHALAVHSSLRMEAPAQQRICMAVPLAREVPVQAAALLCHYVGLWIPHIAGLDCSPARHSLLCLPCRAPHHLLWI